MNVSVHFIQQRAFQGRKCLKEKTSPGKTALRGTWRQAQEKRIVLWSGLRLSLCGFTDKSSDGIGKLQNTSTVDGVVNKEEAK